MTAAHDYEDMHRLVDRMTLAQVRELRRQALRLVDLSDESEDLEKSEEKPMNRDLPFIGIGKSGERDLSVRHEEILCEEFNRHS